MRAIGFTFALDELQAVLIVVPSEVYYQPARTCLWPRSRARLLTRRGRG